jgi:hypothetical protein
LPADFPHRAISVWPKRSWGHYMLFVEKPEIGPGARRIDVRLTRAKGTVFARRTHVD